MVELTLELEFGFGLRFVGEVEGALAAGGRGEIDREEEVSMKESRSLFSARWTEEELVVLDRSFAGGGTVVNRSFDPAVVVVGLFFASVGGAAVDLGSGGKLRAEREEEAVESVLA